MTVLTAYCLEKPDVLFHRRFHFLHAPNFGPARPFPQQSGKFGKLRRSSDGVNFHAAVIDVAHPTSQPSAFADCSTK